MKFKSLEAAMDKVGKHSNDKLHSVLKERGERLGQSRVAHISSVSVYDNVLKREEQSRKLHGMRSTINAHTGRSEATSGVSLGASIAAMGLSGIVDSIVGYVAVEKDLAQQRQIIVLMDKVTTTSGDVIKAADGGYVPRNDAEVMKPAAVAGLNKTSKFDVKQTFSKPIYPGSAKVELRKKTDNTLLATYTDRTSSKEGKLFGNPLYITDSTIQYTKSSSSDAHITFSYGVDLSDYNIVFSAEVDPTNTTQEGTDKMRIKQRHIELDTFIDEFDFTFDTIMDAINQKSIDAFDMFTSNLEDCYNEAKAKVNHMVVNRLTEATTESATTVDLSGFSLAAGEYGSIYSTVISKLEEYKFQLFKKLKMSGNVSAYVVGSKVATLFSTMPGSIGNFVAATKTEGSFTSYIGSLNGVPVIVSDKMEADNQVVMVYKSADGQMAPVVYGIFLPPSDLPVVSRGVSSSLLNSGIYMVHGTAVVSNQLSLKFNVTMPS